MPRVCLISRRDDRIKEGGLKLPDVFVAPGQPAGDAPQENSVPQIKSKKGFSNPFASFAYSPEGVSFEEQEADEDIIFLLRKHWVTNLSWILIGVLMILGPLVIFPLFSRFGLLPQIPNGRVFTVTLFWYLVTFGYLFFNFLSWYFNAYLLTTERAVDIDFYNLMYHHVASTRMNKVQDVSYQQGGVMRSIFNYGDVFIQTAGEAPNFDFLAVPKPALIVEKLNELMAKEEGEGL